MTWDDRRDELLPRALRALDNYEQLRDHSLAVLGHRRAVLASLGDLPRRPSPPLLVGLFGILGIAMTFTMPLHDIVFARLLPITTQALLASFLSASAISALVVTGTLGGVRLGGRHGQLASSGGALVAVGVAAALLLLRLATVQGPEGWILAGGFSLLELCAVLLVERFARRLSASWNHYLEDHETFRAAELQVDVAAKQLEMADAEVERRCRRVEDLGKGGQGGSSPRLSIDEPGPEHVWPLVPDADA